MDGTKVTTLNQYKSSLQYQKTWNSPTYSEGLHTVQFINKATGSKSSNVDAVTVYTTNPTNTPTRTPTNTPTATNTPTNTPTALPPVPQGEIWKYYYFAGAQRVAVRTVSNLSSALSYLLGDHLGSTSITVNPSGDKIAEMRYDAFGNNLLSPV